jgi:hypothetical protein
MALLHRRPAQVHIEKRSAAASVFSDPMRLPGVTVVDDLQLQHDRDAAVVTHIGEPEVDGAGVVLASGA